MSIHNLQEAILNLRTIKPLVLNLTNYVTMDFIANALLAIGAAPLMSVCEEELEELIQISHSVYINLGTLDAGFIQRCHAAALLAKRYHKPVILDPVGAGASVIRTQTARDLLPFVDIVRGNASEIIALETDDTKTLGVESTHSTSAAKKSAIHLAQQYTCTVVVSGPVDFITQGMQHQDLYFGSALMPLITGMGCTLTAIIAAFRGAIPHAFESAVTATEYFGLCGNYAENQTKNPGSFRTAFIDALYEANFQSLEKFYAI